MTLDLPGGRSPLASALLALVFASSVVAYAVALGKLARHLRSRPARPRAARLGDAGRGPGARRPPVRGGPASSGLTRHAARPVLSPSGPRAGGPPSRRRHPWLHVWCRGRCAFGRRWIRVRDAAFIGAVTAGVFVAAAAVPERFVGAVLLVGLITAGVMAERDRTSVPAATPRDSTSIRTSVRPTVGSNQ